LEKAQAQVDPIINAVQAIPSFTPERLIIIKNPPFLNKTKASDDEEDETEEVVVTDDTSADQLTETFTNIPDGVTVIIAVDGSIDMRKRLPKALKKLAKKMEEFHSFARWDRGEIVQWLQRLVKAKEYTIDDETADFIAEVSGHSLQVLNNEVEKIITYLGPTHKKITKEAVTAIISQGELSFFDLGDALRRKDLGTMFSIITRLTKDGEKPQVVLGFLVSQTRFLLQVKDLQQKRLSANEIAAAVKKHPFYVKKIIDNDMSRFSLMELQTLYYALQEADFKGKTGLMPPFLALEMAVASLRK
jgi:DNA polymerase-3 subunit delta